jgi:hypothetical protein
VHWPVNRAEGRRLHIAVPVRLRGIDADGNPFECEAWTLNVSSGGAALHVPATLVVPSQFHLESQDYQFRADAEVFLVWENSKPQHTIGVRIAAETPPEAWQAR